MPEHIALLLVLLCFLAGGIWVYRWLVRRLPGRSRNLPPPSLSTRPTSMLQVLKFLWISYVLSAIAAAIILKPILRLSNFQLARLPMNVSFGIFTIVSGLVINAIIIYKIGTGRAWARASYIGLSVLASVRAFNGIVKAFEVNFQWGALLAAIVVFNILGIVFLLSKSSRMWFRSSAIG